MKNLLLTLSLVLPLAACVPTNVETDTDASSSSSSVASVLTITLTQSTVEDAQSVPHTTAQFVLSGAVDRTIDLPEITGELAAVANSEALAQLTAWFAGAGDEITVTQTGDSLVISHISGDESGACTVPVEVATVAVSSDTEITLVGFENTVEQSSLAFCDQ